MQQDDEPAGSSSTHKRGIWKRFRDRFSHHYHANTLQRDDNVIQYYPGAYNPNSPPPVPPPPSNAYPLPLFPPVSYPSPPPQPIAPSPQRNHSGIFIIICYVVAIGVI
jgi:hypothetical protein